MLNFIIYHKYLSPDYCKFVGICSIILGGINPRSKYGIYYLTIIPLIIKIYKTTKNKKKP